MRRVVDPALQPALALDFEETPGPSPLGTASVPRPYPAPVNVEDLVGECADAPHLWSRVSGISRLARARALDGAPFTLFLATSDFRAIERDPLLKHLVTPDEQHACGHQVFEVVLIHFGVGDPHRATPEHLARIAQMREEANRDPLSSAQTIRLCFTRIDRRGEIELRAGSGHWGRALRDLDFSIVEQVIEPLMVTDIRFDQYGRVRLKLSDGESFVMSRPILTELADGLEIGASLSVKGQLIQIDEGRTRYRELAIHSIEPREVAPAYRLGLSPVTTYSPSMPWKSVENLDDLAFLENLLRDESWVALDVETSRDTRDPNEHWISLLQLGLPNAGLVALVHGEALDAHLGKRAFYDNAELTKVIHYAHFEAARLLERGIALTGALDTWKEMSRLLPHVPSGSLDELLLWSHGIALDKELQSSEWKAPFTQEQLAYARSDVEVLLMLREFFLKVEDVALRPLDCIAGAHDLVEDHKWRSLDDALDGFGGLIESERINLATCTIDQLMRELSGTEKMLAELIDADAPSIWALDARRQTLTARIADLLTTGDFPYDGPAGVATLGARERVVTVRSLEDLLRKRRVLDPTLARVVSEAELLVPRDVLAKIDALPDTSLEVVRTCARESLVESALGDPEVRIEISTPEPFVREASTEIETSCTIAEAMEELSSIYSELRHVMTQIAPSISILNARRAILRDEITERRETYDGEFGVVSVVAASGGLSRSRFLERLRTLEECPEVAEVISLVADCPTWMPLSEAEGILRQAFPGATPSDVAIMMRGIQSPTSHRLPCRIRVSSVKEGDR